MSLEDMILPKSNEEKNKKSGQKSDLVGSGNSIHERNCKNLSSEKRLVVKWRRRRRRRRVNLILLKTDKVPYICLLVFITLNLYLHVRADDLLQSKVREEVALFDVPGQSAKPMRVLSLEEFLAKVEDATTEKAADGPNNRQSAAIRHQAAVITKDENVAASSAVTSEASHLINNEQHHETSPKAPSQNQHNEQPKKKNHHGGEAGGGAGLADNKTKPIPQNYQVRSLLNVTHDYPLAHSDIIYGYAWPLIAAITLFTNLMIVFVLTQHDMRTPTNVVLTAIAIADIIPIVVPVPWFIYLFAMGYEKEVLYPPIACYFYQHSTRSVSEIFYFVSTWLNVLLAIQDYLTACQPKLAKKYCQIRVVVCEIVSLTFLAFLLNLPQALKVVFRSVKFYYHGKLTEGCKALQAKWFKELVGDYVALYDDIFTGIIVVFVDGGPAIALITLTALLIKQLQKQRIRGHMLMEQARTASKRRRERHRQQEYESSARVMIFVLVAFLVVKIPFATTYSLMIIQSRFDIHFVEELVDFQKAISITDLVFVMSYPINFTIFCCCSKKFRHKCAQLLSERHKTIANSAGGRLMRSLSGSITGNSTYNSQRSSLRSITANANQQQPPTPGANKWPPQSPIMEGGQMSGEECANHLSSDKQRLVIVDRLCDGINHLERKDVQLGPPDVAFRALLSDGNLCYECLVRYERFMRYEQAAARRHSISGDTGSHSPSMMITEVTIADSQAPPSPRRQSIDSFSWPPVIPPPPPPIQVGKYHLPHIVTTRCESIKEQPSSDEASAEPPEWEAGHSPAPQPVAADEPLPPPATCLSRRNSRASSGSTTNWCATSSDDGQATVVEEFDNGTRKRQNKRQQQRRKNQLERHNRRRYKFLAGAGRGKRRTNTPSECVSGSESVKRGSSDPGSSSALLNIKQLSQLVVRRSTGHLGEHALRAQQSTGEDEHQRSLSLSNSKLSTLPNATGQLADVLMSTLMFTGGGQTSGSEQKSASRGAVSESADPSRGKSSSSGKKLSSSNWYKRNHKSQKEG